MQITNLFRLLVVLSLGFVLLHEWIVQLIRERLIWLQETQLSHNHAK